MRKNNKSPKGMSLTMALLLLPALSACSGSPKLRSGIGLTVDYRTASPEVAPKEGLEATTETGRRLFGSSVQSSQNGGSNTFFAEGLPDTVRVTWREGTESGKYWSTGRVVGDYTIQVRERVPAEVLRYANAARGRMVRLLFRIKDDGVLLGWDVEETVRHPSGGSGLVYSLHGGDVPCEPPKVAGINPRCTAGPLEQAPWYLPIWIRGE